ncbi:hypothetical protein EYF80_030603 [Liparis tanakae]|uniref:Uncharacterized protein n=1 Tax=Liparis tanakae TaxID=230148 RepID=A0A4Z2H242_9TELE|nr:hypothetical protein EYF80_030603 [Liparis tanakae]
MDLALILKALSPSLRPVFTRCTTSSGLRRKQNNCKGKWPYKVTLVNRFYYRFTSSPCVTPPRCRRLLTYLWLVEHHSVGRELGHRGKKPAAAGEAADAQRAEDSGAEASRCPPCCYMHDCRTRPPILLSRGQTAACRLQPPCASVVLPSRPGSSAISDQASSEVAACKNISKD